DPIRTAYCPPQGLHAAQRTSHDSSEFFDAEIICQTNLACTQSSTVRMGKSAPHGLPVAGLMLAGPVDPKQEPMLLTPMTKKRSVSTALPGPTMLSHQPMSVGSSGLIPATWWDAFRAWQTSTALLAVSFSVP